MNEELVVLDTRSDVVHQLNATASRIWKLRGTGLTDEQIAEALTAEFDIVHDIVYRDVMRTLEDFGKLGILPDGAEGSGLRMGTSDTE